MPSTSASVTNVSVQPEETCCCCISIRAGVIIIAIITFGLSLCAAADAGGGLAKNKWVIHDGDVVVHSNLTGDPKSFKVSPEFSFVFLGSSLLLAAVSVLLLIGACARVGCLLWPFIIYGVAEILVCIGLIIFCVVIMVSSTELISELKKEDRLHVYALCGSSIGILAVIALVIAYFTSVVYRARKVFVLPAVVIREK